LFTADLTVPKMLRLKESRKTPLTVRWNAAYSALIWLPVSTVARKLNQKNRDEIKIIHLNKNSRVKQTWLFCFRLSFICALAAIQREACLSELTDRQ
jgi:hypothetical protein